MFHRIYPEITMPFFRQYIAPLIVVLLFGLALVATSARIFLPNEMAAPAPIEGTKPVSQQVSLSLTASPTYPS
jgi:hypothetical protein